MLLLLLFGLFLFFGGFIVITLIGMVVLSIISWLVAIALFLIVVFGGMFQMVDEDNPEAGLKFQVLPKIFFPSFIALILWVTLMGEIMFALFN